MEVIIVLLDASNAIPAHGNVDVTKTVDCAYAGKGIVVIIVDVGCRISSVCLVVTVVVMIFEE